MPLSTSASTASALGPNVAWLRNRVASVALRVSDAGGDSGAGVGSPAAASSPPPPLPPPQAVTSSAAANKGKSLGR